MRFNGEGCSVKRFREGPVFKAHPLLNHSTLGSRVIKKKQRCRVNLAEVLDQLLLAHKKQPSPLGPPYGPRHSPRGVQFLMSEVPLYSRRASTSPRSSTSQLRPQLWALPLYRATTPIYRATSPFYRAASMGQGAGQTSPRYSTSFFCTHGFIPQNSHTQTLKHSTVLNL